MLSLSNRQFLQATNFPPLDEPPVVLCLVERRPRLEAAQQVGLAGARQHRHYLQGRIVEITTNHAEIILIGLEISYETSLSLQSLIILRYLFIPTQHINSHKAIQFTSIKPSALV